MYPIHDVLEILWCHLQQVISVYSFLENFLTSITGSKFYDLKTLFKSQLDLKLFQ